MIPPTRMTVRWILQRAYRYGVCSAFIDRDLAPGLRTSLALVGVACYRIFKGLLFLPLTWMFGRHPTVTYLRHIWYGAGMLAGWAGSSYDEYREVHGT